MPGLICKIDGIHAILFHMEHSGDVPWHYRWRIIGNFPAPYLVWRQETTKARFVKIISEVRDCLIEVEWRADPARSWSQVALLELDYARAEFVLIANDDFQTPADGFIACAAVRDDGVAAYRFPAMSLKAGEPFTTFAHADAPAWPNVLLAPGEFRPVITGLHIGNTGPSEHSWTEVPHFGAFELCRCPLGADRRWFAVGGHPVEPSLLSMP